jgi:hypothetical protein
MREVKTLKRELWLTQPRVLRVLHNDKLHHTNNRGVHIVSRRSSSPDAVLWNGYDTLRIISFYITSCENELCFTGEDVFNVRNGHLWLLNNPHAIRERRNHLRFRVSVLARIVMDIFVGPYLLPFRLPSQWHRDFMETGPWRCAWSHNAEIVVPVWRSSSALWGKCPALIERYMSRKVDWASRADYTGSSVAGGNACGFFPYGDIWRSMFMLSHLGL